MTPPCRAAPGKGPTFNIERWLLKVCSRLFEQLSGHEDWQRRKIPRRSLAGSVAQMENAVMDWRDELCEIPHFLKTNGKACGLVELVPPVGGEVGDESVI